MPRHHGTALLAQDRVPNLVAHVLNVVQIRLHVMIPGDTFVSELAPRHLRVVLGGRAGLLLLLLYRNGPRIHHLSLQSQDLGLAARRGPPRPRSPVEVTPLYTLEQVSSCAPHLSSRRVGG